MAPFVLIRHAESPWSPDNTRPLSVPGQAAATELVDRLAATDIARIYSSPYSRAIQTVEPLASVRNLPVAETSELRECFLGELGALPFEEAARLAWRNFDLCWPGGESLRIAQRRVLRFVTALAAPGPARPIALSSHGTLLTLLLNAFDASIGYDFWISLQHPDVLRLDLHGPDRATFTRL